MLYPLSLKVKKGCYLLLISFNFIMIILQIDKNIVVKLVNCIPKIIQK